MGNNHNIVILLTSCLRPLNTPDVAITDFKEREKQYVFALNFYEKLGYPIVFIDNSNTVSQAILEIGNNIKDFEYHTFTSLNSNFGKGHGEKEILDYSIDNSKIIKKSDRVIKITGRYCIINIKKIIEKIQFTNADVHVNFSLNITRCDSRMIIYKPSFYISYFKPSLEKYLNESSKMFFETVLSRSVHLLISEGGKFQPWPIYPLYSGINGSNGKKVEFNFLKKIKYRIYYSIKIFVLKQNI